MVKVRRHLPPSSFRHVAPADILHDKDVARLLIFLRGSQLPGITLLTVRRDAVGRALHQERVKALRRSILGHVHGGKQAHPIAHGNAVFVLGVVGAHIKLWGGFRLVLGGEHGNGEGEQYRHQPEVTKHWFSCLRRKRKVNARAGESQLGHEILVEGKRGRRRPRHKGERLRQELTCWAEPPSMGGPAMNSPDTRRSTRRNRVFTPSAVLLLLVFFFTGFAAAQKRTQNPLAPHALKTKEVAPEKPTPGTHELTATDLEAFLDGLIPLQI